MLLKDPLFRNHFDQACNWVVNGGLLTQMLVLEILLRLHLLKPARCPLKFKGQPISLIQVQNIGLSGTNQINPTVVNSSIKLTNRRASSSVARSNWGMEEMKP